MASAGQSRRPGVWLVDDHPVFLAGLREVIADGGGYRVLGASAAGQAARAGWRQEPPEVVLLDLKLQDGSGWALLEDAWREGFRGKILVLTSFCHPLVVAQAEKVGAAGCLAKDDAAAEVHEALDAATQPGPSFFLSAAFAAVADPAVKPLSARELVLLSAIARGATNKEAAHRLGISPRTAETHRERIMQKTGARNVADLTSLALRCGFV